MDNDTVTNPTWDLEDVVPITLGTDGSTRIMAYSDHFMSKNDLLRNIRDRAGNIALPTMGGDGTVSTSLRITSVEPILNSLGYADGYRYRLVNIEAV